MTPLTFYAEDFFVDIEVAPSVINLGSASPWVTVHAYIPYEAFKVGSVSLLLHVGESTANVDPVLCFADDRGDFIAKFDMKPVRVSL